MQRYGDLQTLVRAEALDILGAFHPDDTDGAPAGTQTLLLLGPHEPGFWAAPQASPEFADRLPDALDRWSTRVVTSLADQINATALFPFGGPPYQPFIAWARRSGRAWPSPAGLLVHDHCGLMVSYRGALALPERVNLPALPPCPCDGCKARPCLSACPVGALGGAGYDVAACHGYLDTTPGQDCMSRGCAARRACPVSQSYGRLEAQSAFHMRSFHP